MDEMFVLAARSFSDLVDRIPADAWDGPGLGGWDLRSLVGHTSRSLVTVETYLDRPSPEETLSSAADYYRAIFTAVHADPAAVDERGRQAGIALGADPSAAVHALLDRVLPRVEAAGDPVIETIAGGMRLSAYLPTRTFELVVHSFDIARAARVAPPAPPLRLLGDVASLAVATAVAQGHGTAVILALTGRATLGEHFSVV